MNSQYFESSHFGREMPWPCPCTLEMGKGRSSGWLQRDDVFRATLNDGRTGQTDLCGGCRSITCVMGVSLKTLALRITAHLEQCLPVQRGGLSPSLLVLRGFCFQF